MKCHYTFDHSNGVGTYTAVFQKHWEKAQFAESRCEVAPLSCGRYRWETRRDSSFPPASLSQLAVQFWELRHPSERDWFLASIKGVGGEKTPGEIRYPNMKSHRREGTRSKNVNVRKRLLFALGSQAGFGMPWFWPLTNVKAQEALLSWEAVNRWLDTFFSG